VYLDDKIYLDSEDLRNLGELIDQVKGSQVFVVLWSPLYFTRAWCLIELHVALEYDLPIVVVCVPGRQGFEEAKELIRSSSQATLSEEELQKLEKRGFDVIKMKKEINEVFFDVNTLDFNSSRTLNVSDAEIKDILNRILDNVETTVLTRL